MSVRTTILYPMLAAVALISLMGIGIVYVTSDNQHQVAVTEQAILQVERDITQSATMSGVDGEALKLAESSLANAKLSRASGNHEEARRFVEVAIINLLIARNGGTLPVSAIAPGMKQYGL